MTSKQGKQGHSFLFCLCDMRRAVIMMDILAIIGSLIGLLVTILVEKYADKDDEELAVLLDGFDFWALIVIQVVAVICYFSGLVGALRFSICPVLITILWEITYGALCAYDKNWTGLGVAIFWLYPHLFLCRELAQGVMTEENYVESERQSCCCV